MTGLPHDWLMELYRHMEWADAAVWNVALTHEPAARDARLRNLLLHVHNVQRAFLHVWTAEPLSFPDADDFPDIASVQRWGRHAYEASRRFIASLDAGALERQVVMPWAGQLAERGGGAVTHPTLAETIFQVTSHSTYHRGQVNARLRELGAEPPLVDFIAWIWFGRPGPLWQEAA